MTKVSIIGQGYVGLTISLFAGDKFDVTGFDMNHKIVDQLNLGNSHIEGVDSTELKSLIKKNHYRATTNGADIANSDIVVIAVPTPLTADRKPDLSFIESACKTIGEHLTKPALIINESTSYPGTLRKFIKPAIERYSSAALNHMYAISPERVDPGRTDFNQRNTPRLFAGLTSEATNLTRDFYSEFCDHLVEVSSPEVAEAAKLFENTFRQVNIALVNEFAQIAEKFGISANEVISAAATKPFGFMKFTPGLGVGGHCIPIDPIYLAQKAKSVGATAAFIDQANKVNEQMPLFILKRIKSLLDDNLKDKKICIIGLSYKADVTDLRQSPSLVLWQELEKQGVKVAFHDEIVKVYEGIESSSLIVNAYDLSVVAIRHSNLNIDSLKKSASIIFDCTGSIEGCHRL